MPTPIPFVGPAYTLDSLSISAQRCLNWYPEINQYDSKSAVALKPRPGLKLFASLSGGGIIRGIYTASNSRCFGVCGNTLSEIFVDGTSNVVGTIASTDGIVRMTDNGTQMILIDGASGNGYIYTFATDTFIQISDVDYLGGTHVAFIDQYFLVNIPNTGQYQWCNLGDGLVWQALSKTSAEGSPDNINSIIALGGELWVFGPQSYEVHYSTGVLRGEFTVIQGSNHGVGNVAPSALARSETGIYWIGSDDGGAGRIYTSDGYRPKVISTHAIEQEIQRYPQISDAIGYTYQKNGHDFYVLNFPTPSKTWVYDGSTGFWHEASWTDANNASFMFRGIVQDYSFGKVLVGDWRSASIFEVDPYTYTDNGDLIHRERSSPHIWSNLDRTFYSSFQIDAEVGIGLVSGQGSDPQMMLQISNDGGNTYGSEHWRGAGALGEYRKRIIWNRLGQSRNRVFRIRCTDPVNWVILGAFIGHE